MPRATNVAVLALAAALALTGCVPTTAPEPAQTTTAPQPTPTAQESGRVTADDYTFRLPTGWGYPQGGVPGYDEATFAADLADTDGFADNVNIIASPAGEVTAEQVESLGADELSGAGARDVAVGERRIVAGEEVANLSALVTRDDVDYRVEQYYLTTDGQTFVVTFSFSMDATDEQRADIVGTVLDSWAWT